MKEARKNLVRVVRAHLRRRASLADVTAARDELEKTERAHVRSVTTVKYFRS